MDNISRSVIKKYRLESDWTWSRADRSKVEGGMLVTGKSSSDSLSKTFFISDKELEKSKEGVE